MPFDHLEHLHGARHRDRLPEHLRVGSLDGHDQPPVCRRADLHPPACQRVGLSRPGARHRRDLPVHDPDQGARWDADGHRHPADADRRQGTPTAPTISNLPGAGQTVGGSFTPTVTTTGDGVKSVTSNSPTICTVAGGVVTYIAIGTCSLTAHVAAGTNYNAADGSAQTFTVTVKGGSTVTVTCTAGAPYTYTGSAITPCTAEATGVGMSPVDVTASIVYGSNTNAGAATADASWAGDANHTGSTGTGGFTIGKADASCTVVGYTGTYDGAPHGASGTCTGVGGADLSAGLDLGDSFTNVPGGTASWAFTDASGNYNDDAGTADITHRQGRHGHHRHLRRRSVHLHRRAPDALHRLVTGPGGLNQAVTVDYIANTDAGTATASADYAGDANYNGSSDSKTFDIGKAATVTVVTCGAGPFTYTGSPRRRAPRRSPAPAA